MQSRLTITVELVTTATVTKIMPSEKIPLVVVESGNHVVESRPSKRGGWFDKSSPVRPVTSILQVRLMCL